MNLVLYGAGACGGYVLKHLRVKSIEPLAIVDSNPEKWGSTMPSSTLRDGIEGIEIIAPSVAKVLYPDAEWIACAISRPAAVEIRAQLKAMGVKTKPLYECLDVFHGLPEDEVIGELVRLSSDIESHCAVVDQWSFRKVPDYDAQRPPSDCKDIYFPDFIKHRDDEVFCDLGAACGDTVEAFTERWDNYAKIIAFEPDPQNYRKLAVSCLHDSRHETLQAAVGDHNGNVQFAANGDYSSHVGVGSEEVVCLKLDRLEFYPPPTYIKADIEGSELEMLWGARHILKEHSPVLAICAYHTSDHLWQIPLLIHAIQPDYKLFFRRYAEGAWEIVWYAVPLERVK